MTGHPAESCMFCTRPAHRHHPTGRAGAGACPPYADPAVTVPLCPAHHGDEHAIWRALRVAGNDTGDDRAAALLRLRRLAVLAQRAAEQWPEPFAAFAAAVAAVLPRVIASLETGPPDTARP